MAFTLSSRAPCSTLSRRAQAPRPAVAAQAVATKHKVVIEHNGKTVELQVAQDEPILQTALDAGLDLPHDCKLGVCCQCASKLVSGKVDLGGSMLSDEVAEKGYTLLCVATPTTDCRIKTVTEDELLDEQFSGIH